MVSAPAKVVAPNGTTTFTVRFAPVTAGAKTSKVVIFNDSSRTFAFSASAVATTSGSASGAILEVRQGTGSVQAGSSVAIAGAVIGTSSETTFTIVNAGTADLNVSSVSVSGAEYSITQNATGTVAPGGSTTFVVKLSPVSDGAKLGQVTIANDTQVPFVFSVLAIASAKPEPSMTLVSNDATIGSAGTLAFGSLVVGATLEKTLVIKNVGTADLVLAGNPVVSGSAFSLKSPPSTTTIGVGASTPIVLTFSSTSPGAQVGTLAIPNNTDDMPTYLVNLTGNGFINATAFNVTSVGGRDTLTTRDAHLQLLANVIPANAENKVVNWMSESPAVASVDANGLVSAVGNGTAVIRATAADGSGITGAFTVTANIPFVYFVKQAVGTTTASMTDGAIAVSATWGSSGNAFKYVAPNYYGTNSNGFISFPSLMAGDFTIEAEVTVTAQNKANNACGIGIGLTTGYNPADSYAYLVMRNSTNLAQPMYVNSASSVGSSGSPSVTFSNGTPLKLSFKRVGTNLTYGAGPVDGTLTSNTAGTSNFTNGTTVYANGPVYPAISFNNVNATINRLVVKNAAGDTVFDQSTGILVNYVPAALNLSSASIALKKGAQGTVTATATAVGGVPSTVSAVSADETIATVAVANGPTNSTITVTGIKGGVTTVTVSNDADSNSVTKTKTIQVAVNEYASTDLYSGLDTRAYPAPGTTNAYTDGELALTFDSTPTLNSGGSIKIYKSADGTEVDSIAFAGETQTFGATSLNVDNQLVRISGNTLYFTPHLGKLTYGTGYYVVIPTTSVTGTLNGTAFNGFSDLVTVKTWNFTTRAAPALDYANLTVDGAQASTANFRTIQGALNAIAAASPAPTTATVSVAPGTYYELLRYVAPAAASNQTIRIVGPANNAKGDNCIVSWKNGNSLNGSTHTRASFYVTGANLVLENLTFKNTAVRSSLSQAETLYFASGGDFTLAAFNCSFVSKQDTLQTSGRNWFYKCYIEGNVDYIWGTAHAALFEDCDLRTINDVGGTTAQKYSLVVARTGTTIAASANGTIGKGYVVWKSRVKVDDYATQSFGRDAGTGSFYDQVSLIDVAFSASSVAATGASLLAGYWDVGTSPLKLGDASYVGWKATGCTWQGAPIDMSTTAAGTSAVIASQSSEFDTRDHILNRVVTVTAGVPSGYQAVSSSTTGTTTWDTSSLAAAWGAP
ncbi:MAG: pectinesterase family protein [Polyangiaceae bacterium]